MSKNHLTPQFLNKEEISRMADLLLEHAAHLQNAVNERDKSSERRLFMALVATLIPLATVLVIAVVYVVAPKNTSGYTSSSAILLLSGALAILTYLALMLLLKDEQKKTRIAKRVVSTLAAKLAQVIGLVSAIREFYDLSPVDKLELELRLQEAETTLIYAGYPTEAHSTMDKTGDKDRMETPPNNVAQMPEPWRRTLVQAGITPLLLTEARYSDGQIYLVISTSLPPQTRMLVTDRGKALALLEVQPTEGDECLARVISLSPDGRLWAAATRDKALQHGNQTDQPVGTPIIIMQPPYQEAREAT